MKDVMKICKFCGHITSKRICSLCYYDHGESFEKGMDFKFRNPLRIDYLKLTYSNWVERFSAFKPLLYHHMPSAPQLIIDIGCGPNEFIRQVRSDFPHVQAFGYDQFPLSKDVIALDFEHASLPYANQQSDFVLLSHVIEHVENMHVLLDEAFRVGKRVAVVLPNPCNIFFMLRVALFKERHFQNGLPLIRPMERHRWFYTVHEADTLMGYYAERFSVDYRTIYLVARRAPRAIGPLNRNLFVSEMMYLFGTPG